MSGTGAHPVARVFGMDLLRALAITLVVVGHQAIFFLGTPVWDSLMRWGRIGVVGVDLFFVLSGFLIGGILLGLAAELRAPRILLGFWISRWLRTLPSYYLFLLINLVIWLAFGLPPTSWKAISSYPFFLQNFAHGITGFFPESWSLCVEEWFYLLFPLVLCLGLKKGGNFTRLYAVTAGAMVVGSVLFRSRLGPALDWDSRVNGVVLHKFDAIGLGVIAALLARTYPLLWRKWRKVCLWGGVMLIAECYLYSVRVNLSASLFGRALYPTFAAMGWALLLPAADAWRTAAPTRWVQGVVAIARWSYSLYLTNFAISLLLFVQVRLRMPSGYGGVLLCEILFFGLSVGLSAALYRHFERPFLDLRSRVGLCRELARAGAPVIPPLATSPADGAANALPPTEAKGVKPS